MVWDLSAILSFALPTNHTATFDRKCEFSHVDFQLVFSNASAAINGILSLRIKNTFYIFDLKICMFVIEEPADRRDRLVRDSEYHLLKAIPLGD
ncbi:hypothetical protein DYB30_007250 [Aphanomyces astaci]|uniref:Uncharacterized protein n=1 Tax=Aphanomyces astaci TaxID=112090 RepID=A0A397ERL4_APHAT|nr:hypothetical protein DYB38_013358 [Aphanomyces astaci]RHY71032.1 hypothetical protein DYB30_007250 [Aphanomyces astaci]RHY83207.1 hypothetical protein DYB26_007588 [Aphanomyces astaci]RHY95181.1 hypothetical protein DYB31_004900 [Aphanomyces astaci]